MLTFKEIIDALAQVPMGLWTLLNAFVSALAGLTGALTAVYLTNRANDKRLREQFDHEREAKRTEYENQVNTASEEREFELRRDIYLATVEAAQASMVGIMKLADMRHEVDSALSAFSEKAPAIAKVQLIARMETFEAIYSLVASIAEVVPVLMAQRSALSFLQGRQKKSESVKQDLEAAILLKRNEINQLTISGEIGGLLGLGVKDQLRSLEAQLLAANRNCDELMQAFVYDQMVFLQACSSEVVRLQRQSVPALLAMREDIKMPVDKQQYTVFLEDILTRQHQMISKYIEEIKERVGRPQFPHDPALNR